MENKYVCAKCGHEQDSMNRKCDKCGLWRVILISVAENMFGPNWKDNF